VKFRLGYLCKSTRGRLAVIACDALKMLQHQSNNSILSVNVWAPVQDRPELEYWATKVLEPRSSCRSATATRVRKECGLWQALPVVDPAAAHLVDDDVVHRGAGHRDQPHPGLSESGIRPCGD
jgi:hypothetical protein